MSTLRLVLRGLLHFRRTHLGVAAGMAVAAAVLVGALAVGDSVRASLLERSLERVGRVDVSLGGGDRLLRAALADELEEELEGRIGGGGARVAPVLRLDGVASVRGGARRANGLAVHGVDGRFLALSPGGGEAGPGQAPLPGQAWLARPVAEQLGVVVGDEVLLRVEEPSALSRDLILAPTEDTTAVARVDVAAVLDPDAFARFGLVATPRPPANVFVELGWLQERLDLAGRANLFLVDGPGDPTALAGAVDAALRARWTLEDLELELVPCLDVALNELRSPRVFLEDPLVDAARDCGVPLLGIATYFVNALRHGERTTPYSMVSALAPLAPSGAEEDPFRSHAGRVARGAELVATDWLAADLELEVGDEVELEYFVPGADRRLRVERSTHRLARVVPLDGAAADPGLMPEFPGLGDAENCRDWDTGVPVDLDAIRDEDEAYWDEHRGTPKAYVSLEQAREHWGSRFGSLTALRLPAGDDERLVAGLREHLDPRALGLHARDVRTPALARADSPTDFGGLFLGLSFFLIGSALLLVALLFGLGVEQRSREVGLLLAVGFPARRVRRLLLCEAAGVALAGVLLGTPLGVLYTRALVAGLGGAWSGAVAGTEIRFHLRGETLALGAGAALLAGLLAAALVLRRLGRRPAAVLLRAREGVAPEEPGGSRPRLARVLGPAALVGTAALLVLAPRGSGSEAAGLFFGAGSLALVALASGVRLLLAREERGGHGSRPLARPLDLARRNASRRPGRSLATVTLLASGAFLVLSIGVHHRSGTPDPTRRDSGTGGFLLYGSSTLAFHDEPGTPEGRRALGLDGELLSGVEFVPLRVRAGDDASCLNLGAPQNPRLVGVRPEQLAARGAFAFAEVQGELAPGASPWTLLEASLPDGSLPAVADQASVRWTLKKSVGDILEYQDGRGETLRVRLVATLADSILQGDVLIAEQAFQRHYPGEDGFRGMLVDAPRERADAVAEELGRGLEDAGLEVVPTDRRLRQFQAVQNTYLAIFQVLGALGVLLGSAGLGAIVLRNALERRGELALLAAVGFRRARVRGLLVEEHLTLLLLGLGSGAVAALIALVPAPPGAAGPLLLAGLGLALVLNGLFWVVLAAAGSVRGTILSGLRDE